MSDNESLILWGQGSLAMFYKINTQSVTLFWAEKISGQSSQGSSDANSFWGFGHNRGFSHQVKNGVHLDQQFFVGQILLNCLRKIVSLTLCQILSQNCFVKFCLKKLFCSSWICCSLCTLLPDKILLLKIVSVKLLAVLPLKTKCIHSKSVFWRNRLYGQKDWRKFENYCSNKTLQLHGSSGRFSPTTNSASGGLAKIDQRWFKLI